MNSRIIILCIFLLVAPSAVQSQDKPTIQLSAYGELYYGFDFNQPQDNNRPSYIVSHNRHNEVNLNLVYLKAAYEAKKIRANIALMTGTYANANLANEPGVLKNIFEANAGVKLSRKHALWLDAGVMPSHIGFESAIGKDNRTLTRSLMADNSPYFETGAKLNYTSRNEKWYIALLTLNGWQNIQRPAGNSTPAFGGQITYKPTDKLTLNYSNLVCNLQPDSNRRWRWYHNFYAIYSPIKKLEIIAACDIGAQQFAKGSDTFMLWYTPVLIARYKLSKTIAVAARGEYFYDLNAVITNIRLQTWGYSLNMDYSITKHAMLRIEGKLYNSSDNVFVLDNKMVNNNGVVTAALCVAF
ncbi:hypothetical protein CAP35_08125 [Chitinophagaceae bacterium IBVUCB1]|nr:hypothetical protein CAP35_08125 [Chitinophagaceae bacterium IBVUCB1]